jgi:hypothetical protein
MSLIFFIKQKPGLSYLATELGSMPLLPLYAPEIPQEYGFYLRKEELNDPTFHPHYLLYSFFR